MGRVVLSVWGEVDAMNYQPLETPVEQQVLCRRHGWSLGQAQAVEQL